MSIYLCAGLKSLIYVIALLTVFVSIAAQDTARSSAGYVLEQQVIDFAKSDLQIFRNASLQQKPLLCVTFTKPNVTTIDLLKSNVKEMGTRCDWAVIFYRGSDDEIAKVCSDQDISRYIVHCKRNEHTKVVRTVLSRTNETIPIIVPKTVLYQDLLPLLPLYRRVFAIDDDISLSGFDSNRYMLHWDCALRPSPLITQPLVFESNQHITYLNLNAWQKVVGKDGRKVLASEIGFVEQQVPMLDSAFFDWYIRRVLNVTLHAALVHGVDWGGDRSWCAAAHMYAVQVLQYPESFVACAVLPSSSPIHHLNHHSIDTKRQHKESFTTHAAVVVREYLKYFPTWTLRENPVRSANPLYRKSKKVYTKVTRLGKKCAAKHPYAKKRKGWFSLAALNLFAE